MRPFVLLFLNGDLRDSRVVARLARKADLILCADGGARHARTLGVVPDFDLNGPRFEIEDAVCAYPVWNSKGQTVELARVYMRDWFSLCADYPELHNQRDKYAAGIMSGNRVEVVKYVSKHRILVYLPHLGNLVLEDMVNPLGVCNYVAVQRPSLDDEIRGAYDDVIWVQLARHRIQMLLMEGVEKSVRAPLVVTPDVTDLAIGPDSVITAQGGAASIGRARIDMPAQAFGAVEQLKSEQMLGAMSPEFRSGKIGRASCRERVSSPV